MKNQFLLKPFLILSYFLEKTQSFIVNKRAMVLSVFLPFFLYAFYLGTKTKIAVRTEDFSNPELASYKKMQELKEEFAFEDKLTLFINKGSALTEPDLCLIQNWLSDEIKNNKNVLRVASLFDLRAPSYSDKLLFYPKLIKGPCEGLVDFDGLLKHPLLKMFATPNLSDMVIQLEIRPSEKSYRHGIYDYSVVKDIIESAKTKLPFEILPGGTLFFQASVLDGIQFANVVNLIAVFFLVSLYYFFYRSLLFAGIMIGIIFLTNTLIKAGMTLAGHSIDPLSSCIFLMITVAILEDYILLSYMVFKKKWPYREAIKKLLLPSFLTSLTTAIGFGSLSVSDNPSIVHFSQWTAFGAVFEWIGIFLLLPAIVFSIPGFEKRINAHPSLEHVIPKELIKFRLRKPFSIVLALIPFTLFFIHQKANFNYSPYDMFPDSHEIAKIQSHFLKTRQAEGEISVLFSEDKYDLRPFIEEFKRHPMVSDAFSENDVLGQIIKTLPAELHSLIMEDFRRTPLGKFFKSSSNRRVVLSIKSYNIKDIPEMVSSLEKICQGHCTLTSEIIASNEYASGVLTTLYDSASTGFGAILLLIGWLVLATGKRYFLPVVVSSLWASFALLLVVVVFQVKVNIVTCVALSVLIGAAGDNAIQFLLFSEGSLLKSVSEIGEASSENFLMMMAMASTLLFSYFSTPRDLSFLLLLGIVLMFLGDIWILNGLISKKE